MTASSQRAQPRALVPASSHAPVSMPPRREQPPAQHQTEGYPLLVPPAAPAPRAFEIIASRVNDPEQTEETLQAAMQSLVLDARRPVALEIWGIGATGHKPFLIRATDAAACSHAEAHIRGYAPQVGITTLTGRADPLHLEDHETVSVYELRPGAAAYLPMREMYKTDPVRAVLAALTLPSDMRAAAQLALVPATPTWSQGNMRKAVEHPLEQERHQHRESAGVPSQAGLLVLGIMFGLLCLASLFPARTTWILHLGITLLVTGHLPPFTAGEAASFATGLAALVLVPAVLLLLLGWLTRRFFGTSIYDQRAVARKTGQMAYRVRLRLYAVGPGPVRSYRRLYRRYGLLLSRSMWRQFRQQYVRLRPTLLHALSAPIRQCRTRLLATVARFPRLQQALRKAGISIAQGVRRLDQILTPPSPLRPTRPRKLLSRGLRHWSEESHWRRLQWHRRREILTSLVAAYRQFNTASSGYFVPARLPDRQAHRLVEAGQWATGVSNTRHYITADFLSRAWYIPTGTMLELPGIAQKRARTLLVPTPLIAPAHHARILGISRHASYAYPFALPPGFLSNHTLIGGKSGEGKSTLMIHLAREAIEHGALCVLDPHGDLAHDILRSVPEERWDDVVFLDLGNSHYAVGLNPLDVTLGRDRDLMVAALVDAFRKIWESGWGNRMEAPFRSALMTLYEANEVLVSEGKADEQYTLQDVAQLLLDESFCHMVLAQVRDIYLHRFWYQYFDPLDLRQQRERIDPVITKMLQFESKVARRILGQSRSTINLSEVLRDRKILIIRLAASEAGLAAPILGATLLGLIMVVLREQSVMPLEERVCMSIMVDEFQSIPGADYAQLLAETRKFGGAAILATQSFEYLDKVSPHVKATTLANVKQYFMFRLSADDARLIARELGDVTDEDILNLDAHSCYVKLIHHQQQQPTFSIEILRPPLAARDVIDQIRLRSMRYTRPASEIEQHLFLAMARALQATPPSKHKTKKHQTAQGEAPMQTVETTMQTADASGAATTTVSTTTRPSSAPPSEKERPVHIRFHKRSRPRPDDEADLISSFDLHPDPDDETEREDA